MSSIRGYNILKNGISKFFKLKNGQWMKVLFSYEPSKNIWFENVVVANSKRQCNDCLNKTEHSPKVFYGQSTGNKAGIEPFKIALKELLKFEKTISNTQINIVGANNRLNNIYTYLKRYGYIQFDYEKDKKKTTLIYKKIKYKR